MTKKTGPKTDWSKQQLDSALSHYSNSDDGFRVTARQYGVPKTTLRRYWDKYKDSYLKGGPDQSGPVQTDPDQSEPVRTDPPMDRTSPDRSDQSEAKVKGAGPALAEMHAYKAELHRGQTFLKIGIGILVGLFVQEIVKGRTGDTLFGWLTGQPKLQRTNERNVEAVLPSTTDKYFKAQPQPQLQGYDLSVFK